jgi:hypothetical protein
MVGGWPAGWSTAGSRAPARGITSWSVPSRAADTRACWIRRSTTTATYGHHPSHTAAGSCRRADNELRLTALVRSLGLANAASIRPTPAAPVDAPTDGQRAGGSRDEGCLMQSGRVARLTTMAACPVCIADRATSVAGAAVSLGSARRTRSCQTSMPRLALVCLAPRPSSQGSYGSTSVSRRARCRPADGGSCRGRG